MVSELHTGSVDALWTYMGWGAAALLILHIHTLCIHIYSTSASSHTAWHTPSGLSDGRWKQALQNTRACLPARLASPPCHVLIFKTDKKENHAWLREARVTSTTPAIQLHSCLQKLWLKCWQKRKSLDWRGQNATSNNMASFSGFLPTPSPIDQIFTEQQVERKGSGQAPASHRMLLRIQAPAAHGVMLPGAVSWGGAASHPH